jgi:hypothetical protein
MRFPPLVILPTHNGTNACDTTVNP